MRTLLDALRQSLPSLMQQFAQTADPDFQWPVDGPVYQYTRFETLRAMIGGSVIDTASPVRAFEAIWATSSIHLNDSKEFERGREVIAQELAALPNDEVKRRMTLALRDSDALEVYCACFSAEGDDLSQWRGYGDNGFGVCVGFDIAELIAHLDGVGYWVVYGKPDNEVVQRNVARGLVGYLHSSISAALPAPNVPGAVYEEIREQLTEIWPALCLAFKHADFSAEKEFRIAYSEAVGRSLPVCFRPAPVVPFVKLQMRKPRPVPVNSIRLGPAVGTIANLRSLELALGKLGFGGIQVNRSDIPYVPR